LPEKMRNLAIKIARKSLESIKVMASNLSQIFNEKYGTDWICFVSDNPMAFSFTPTAKTSIWFTMGTKHILLFKPQNCKSNEPTVKVS
jgi:hypothetical protein